MVQRAVPGIGKQATCGKVSTGGGRMTAEDILEQISGILEDESTATAKVYMIKDIIHSEIAETKSIKLDEANRAAIR